MATSFENYPTDLTILTSNYVSLTTTFVSSKMFIKTHLPAAVTYRQENMDWTGDASSDYGSNLTNLKTLNLSDEMIRPSWTVTLFIPLYILINSPELSGNMLKYLFCRKIFSYIFFVKY